MFEAGDLVAQDQPALLESAHHEFVDFGSMGCAIYQRVEVRMFDAQLNQPALR